MTPPIQDGPFAEYLAGLVGGMLRRLRDETGFADPDALRAAGDKNAHDMLLTELGQWRPGDAVLSEEGVRDDPARLASDRVWIVDPLDGTREFGEPGRVDWAVHVALWDAKESRLAAGAIALPAQARVLATDPAPAHPPARSGAGIRIATSRTRPPAFLPNVADQVNGVLVPMGSAGAKIAAVITGEVDAYIHAGGQYEWDSAAPVAVALAAGLHASRIDGSPLVYNRPDPSLPDLLVCRAELAETLLSAVSQHR